MKYQSVKTSVYHIFLEDESDDSFKKACEESEIDAHLNEISEYEDIRLPKIARRQSSDEESGMQTFKHADIELGQL